MGLGKNSVERLYKGLFVYSIGFNELVRSITKKANNSFSVICSVWKVYSILLEFWWKSDYSLLIGQVTAKYLENENKIKVEYQQKYNKNQDFVQEVIF